MNGDEKAGGCVDGAKRKKAEGRGCVEHDNIVIVLDFADREPQALEEKAVLGGTLFGQLARRFVLVFHDLDVAGNEVDAVKIGVPDDLTHRTPLQAVAEWSVNRLIVSDVHFRLGAEHS